MHQRTVVRRRPGDAAVRAGGRLSGGHVLVPASPVHEQGQDRVHADRPGPVHSRRRVRGRRIRQDGQFVESARPFPGLSLCPSPPPTRKENFFYFYFLETVKSHEFERARTHTHTHMYKYKIIHLNSCVCVYLSFLFFHKKIDFRLLRRTTVSKKKKLRFTIFL